MFRKFVADSRKVVVDAREVARDLESSTVEAEHLLLAVSHGTPTPAGHVLRDAGLDYEGVRDALDAEFEDSLAAVGVSLADFDLAATAEAARSPRWGTSAKLALQRALKIAESRRDRRLTSGHIVLGVLAASAGTVPRALDRAGIDRVQLSNRVAEAL